jgi:hypothetical protein
MPVTRERCAGNLGGVPVVFLSSVGPRPVNLCVRAPSPGRRVGAASPARLVSPVTAQAGGHVKAGAERRATERSATRRARP